MIKMKRNSFLTTWSIIAVALIPVIVVATGIGIVVARKF